jgi:integration host factor subunit alpha
MVHPGEGPGTEGGRLNYNETKSGTAVTRVDLIEAVYRKVGLSRAESAGLVELVFKEITDCLVGGEPVKLSSFGSFVVRSKGAPTGRNPKTGVEVAIAPRRVMVFKASDTLGKRLAGGGENGRLEHSPVSTAHILRVRGSLRIPVV